MKKLKFILVLITILGSYLIFSMNFNNFSNQKMDYNFSTNEFSKYSDQYVRISGTTAIENKAAYYTYITQLADKYNVSFYMNTTEFIDERICKRMYMYTQNSKEYIQNSFFVDYKLLDFTDYNENGYYTSRMNDKKASGHIYYLSKDSRHDTNVEVYPFGYAARNLDKLDNEYQFYAESKEKLNKFLSEFKNNPLNIRASSIVTTGGDANSFYISKRAEYQKQYLFILMFLFVVSFLVYISKHEQEIVVRKLQGISELKIFTQLFGKLTLLIIGVNVFTMSILCFLNIEYYNWVTKEFIWILVTYVFLIVFILFGLSFLMMLYFRMVNLSLSLKKQNKRKYLMNASWCIKFIVLFIVLSTLYPLCTKVFMLGKDVLIYHDVIQKRGSVIYIDGYKYGYNDYFINIEDQKKIVNVLLKYGATYYDHSSYISSVDSDDDSKIENSYYVSVNRNYMDKYPVYGKNNKKIKFDGKDTIFLISDKMAKDNEFPTNVGLLAGLETEAEKVYVSHTKGDILQLKVEGLKTQFQDRAIKVIEDDYLHYFMPSNTFVDIGKSQLKQMRDELNSLFPEKDYLNLYNYGEYLSGYYQGSLNSFLDNLFHFISLILIIGMLMYEYVYLYLDINKKEIAIKNTLGYKYADQYGRMYVLNSSPYLFLLVVFIARGELSGDFITTIICLFIIESSLTYIMTYLFEKKNIALILKGDED